MTQWYTYILRCRDGSLYSGCTTDVARRLHEHNESVRGARYTKSRRPVEMVYTAMHASRSAASIHEHYLKSLTREEKQALITEERSS